MKFKAGRHYYVHFFKDDGEYIGFRRYVYNGKSGLLYCTDLRVGDFKFLNPDKIKNDERYYITEVRSLVASH